MSGVWMGWKSEKDGEGRQGVQGDGCEGRGE